MIMRPLKGPEMNLPAKATSTWVGASALEHARAFLARMREPAEQLGGLAPLNPDAGYVMAKYWLRNTALVHPLNLSQLVDLATIYGEQAAHDVLIELIIERQHRGEDLGPILTAYDIRLKHAPFKPRGGWSRNNFVEDIVLFTLILDLRERFCLKPTRHQPPKPGSKPSACSVAAEAAEEAALGRGTEGAFQQLWRKYKPSVLPGYQWPDWGRALT
jgi:hypothetical protein